MRLSRHYRVLRLAAGDDAVPPAPGTISLPADSVRLYHYTRSLPGEDQEQVAARLRQGGIDIGRARGSTYGEPNAVWASTEVPNRGKVYAEFSMHKDDPRWGIGRPKMPGDVDRINQSNVDVTFQDSIRPEEILAVHQPWHHSYRYLQENDMFPEVLRGDYDYLLDTPDMDEAKAIQYIKEHHHS